MRELRHVRQQQRDVLAASDAELRQRAGEPLRVSVERLVRKLCCRR